MKWILASFIGFALLFGQQSPFRSTTIHEGIMSAEIMTEYYSKVTFEDGASFLLHTPHGLGTYPTNVHARLMQTCGGAYYIEVITD